MSKTDEIVLNEKIEEVKNKTLHKNWLAWYDRRKNITGSNKIYSKIMLNGLIEDFYSVTEHQQQELEKLRKENEELMEQSFKFACKSTERLEEIIAFSTWYSGMDKAKVEKAYERYLKENKTKG